ncbi:hypothetical protein ACM66B_006704 [Microbotryomycetes sp. NB124-2]
MAFAPRDVNVGLDNGPSAHATVQEKSTMRSWSFPRGPVVSSQDQNQAQPAVRFATSEQTPAFAAHASAAHGRSSSIAPSPNKSSASGSTRARLRSRDFRHRSTTSAVLAPSASSYFVLSPVRGQAGLVSRWKQKPLAEWLYLFVFCACLLVFALATSGFGVSPAQTLVARRDESADLTRLEQAKSIEVPIPEAFNRRRTTPFGQQQPPEHSDRRSEAVDSKKRFLQVRVVDRPASGPDPGERTQDGEAGSALSEDIDAEATTQNSLETPDEERIDDAGKQVSEGQEAEDVEQTSDDQDNLTEDASSALDGEWPSTDVDEEADEEEDASAAVEDDENAEPDRLERRRRFKPARLS